MYIISIIYAPFLFYNINLSNYKYINIYYTLIIFALVNLYDIQIYNKQTTLNLQKQIN